MNVVQVSTGRFHHFHLARQMGRHDLLDAIWTGYPLMKLKDERGIPSEKIKSFPYLQTPFMAWNRVSFLRRFPSAHQSLGFWSRELLDRKVARTIKAPCVVLALSSMGEHCGRAAQKLGGYHICDRGSSHIQFQQEILREEHKRWNVDYMPIDVRTVAKEEREYATADRIFVPSEFVRQSFLAHGVDPTKIVKIPYGANRERFQPAGSPTPDRMNFLFVGQFSLRKGAPYLLEAFAAFRHPRKLLTIIGDVQPKVARLISKLPTEHVIFLGNVPNTQLSNFYSHADALILPSLEEGLAMVMAEALACGCPVIATSNTGADDLFSHGEEGFILPIRDTKALTGAMEAIAESKSAFRPKALARVSSLRGWNGYGDHVAQTIKSLRA